MKRCLIWGTGDFFYKYLNVFRYYESIKMIEVVGVTSKDVIFEHYLEYKFYSYEQINNIEFDYVIIATDSQMAIKIMDSALKIGIDKKKIIRIAPLLLPDFCFDEYEKISQNPPSIFADNCWGGITSARLGLEFKSPFVNMWVKNDSYIRFLENARHYIDSPIEFVEMKYAPLVNQYYPLCRCDDIELRFNHYKTFDDANTKWEKRKTRIDWDNLFVVMITEDKGMASRFCNLPYKNKLCFVPFNTNAPELFYVDIYQNYSGPFWQIVVEMAQGKKYYYSIIDMMNGKITKLSGMKHNE